MIPIISLIGRSNVGKSTLFNCLTSSRNAIVSNSPKSTYDRQYGYINNFEEKFIIIDTGGIIEGAKNIIEKKIIIQANLAINESDAIFFLVDARTGIMYEDKAIAKNLRSFKKKVFLLINKTENLNKDFIVGHFQVLGLGKAYTISSSHNLGIKIFLKNILFPWIQDFKKSTSSIDYKNFLLKKLCLKNNIIKFSIIGCPNVGKSTLINSFLKQNRLVESEIPGTTRDSISIPIEYNNKNYILIDTAGIKRKNSILKNYIQKIAICKTLNSIENSNIVILVIDALKSITAQDLSLISFIINKGKTLVIAINKCDLLSEKEKISLKKELYFRLRFIKYVPMYFVSAIYRIGIDGLFRSVIKIDFNSVKKIKTPVLNKILKMAINYHQPPFFKRKRIKLKYAHIIHYHPLTIVIHGNKVKNLPNFYKSYLINYFRDSLNIKNIPIKLLLKQNANPFK